MTAALLAVVLAGGVATSASRLAPLPAITCPRDRLTSYTGRVVSYRRTPEALTFTVRTDWGTTEEVRLAPPRPEHLRLGGAPFAAENWARIESTPGELRPGARATVWVCDDGRPPLIDWQPVGAAGKPE